MIRKKNKFAWPRKLYDTGRIQDENKLVTLYGLKNKREIWKAESKIKYFRSRAKDLITADQDEQQNFFSKLQGMGLKVNSIADVLALDKKDLLARRLPSILVSKGLATTPQQARQMVTHKRVFISGKAVSVPGYIVRVQDENHISIKKAEVKIIKEKQNKGEIINE